MSNAQQKARIKWACRRGMLELDVLLMPFFEQHFDKLSEEEQQDFVALLACDDPDIFMWLMGHGQSDVRNIAMMVDKIVSHNRSQLR